MNIIVPPNDLVGEAAAVLLGHLSNRVAVTSSAGKSTTKQIKAKQYLRLRKIPA